MAVEGWKMDAGKESCPTKMLLLNAWQTAAEKYSKAVAELTRNVGVISKEEYHRLKDAAEQARKRSIDAQRLLEAHIEEHGCDGDDTEAVA